MKPLEKIAVSVTVDPLLAMLFLIGRFSTQTGFEYDEPCLNDTRNRYDR